MSDSNNSFGEALESMATNTKKAIGGTIADFTKSAANQVKGNAGLSGSFTPGQQSPNTLSGGDLFSPDIAKAKQQTPLMGTMPQNANGQKTPASSETKTPEELAKIQSIKAELQTMHDQYYQDFKAKAEGRDRKTLVEKEEKQQEEQQQQMVDLQKEEKKQQATDVFQAQRSAEIKGGSIG